MPRLLIVATVTLLLIALVNGVGAQDNLLNNPSFEGDYTGRGRFDFNIANGWGGWYINQPSTESWMNIDPIAYPHPGSFKRDGEVSQDMGRGSGTFTGAVYQSVPNLAQGTTLRGTVWVFLETADDKGARARIGIGSNTENPTDPNITWSPFMRTVNSWQQIEVTATVPAGNATLFIYMTQDWPNDPNRVYLDQAELIATGTGEVVAPDDTPLPPTNTPIPFVPFVQPQAPQDDGRTLHRVTEGDTLASIAVAYGVPISRIQELNNVSGSLILVGQTLLIRQAPTPDPLAPLATATIAEPQAVGDPVQATTNAMIDMAVQGTLTAQAPVSAAPTQVVDEPLVEEAVQPTNDPGNPLGLPTPVAVAGVFENPTETPTETTDDSGLVEQPAEPTPLANADGSSAPAPVTPGAASADPNTIDSTICVSMFNDMDQNRIQGPNEGLLSGGVVILRDSSTNVVGSYTTDGVSEPHCFGELAAGNYTIGASAPTAHSLTTPQRLTVTVQPGTQFQIRFGAASTGEAPQDVNVPQVDPVNNADPLDNVGATDPGAFGEVALLLGGGVALISNLLASFLAG